MSADDRVTVCRVRHGHGNTTGPRNWKVIDRTGPKVFTRVFVFSTWWAAMRAADRIANRKPIDPWGLKSVHTDRSGS